MKTAKAALVICTFALFFQHNVQAQLEESVFVNGTTLFIHKDVSIELKSILGGHIQDTTYLAWLVSNLKCEGSFLIYRSVDGENYEIVGTMRSIKTNNKSGMGYFFIDPKPVLSQISYYKIIHLGTDNSYFTSENFKMEPVADIANIDEIK